MRARTWFLLGAAAVCILLLRDASGQLASISAQSGQSFDADVFTGLKIKFFDISDLETAMGLWSSADNLPIAIVLTRWHLIVDLVFVLAYGLLLSLLIRRVGGPTERAGTYARRIALAVIAVDLTETLLTLTLFEASDLDPDKLRGATFGFEPSWLHLLQTLSLAKWIAIGIAMTSVAVMLRAPEGMKVGRGLKSIRRAHRGGQRSPAIALSGLILLVALLALVVAVPAGGALEQLPDVLRFHFDDPLNYSTVLLSSVALAAFAACIGVAGLAATRPDPWSRTEERPTIPNRWVVGAGLVISSVLLLTGFLRGQMTWSNLLVPLMPLLITLALWGLSRVVPPAQDLAPDSSETDNQELATDPEEDSTWVFALVGSVIVIGGLGLVRAALGPLIFAPAARWVWVLAFASVVAVFGGWTIQRILTQMYRKEATRLALKVVAVLAVAFVGYTSLILAETPSSAFALGTNGSLAVGFSALALLIGFLNWASATKPSWAVSQRLRFGRRTPWLSILILIWVAAGLFNTTGGYHDAQLAELPTGEQRYRYEDIEDAFHQWVAAQKASKGCFEETTSIPFVLVAAPGGGIRAAYWTATGLDALFSNDGSECAPLRPFAMSGVSGGSVGITVWAASPEGRARNNVAPITGEHGLASAIASLFFRDFPASFIGVAGIWRDRAAVLEDVWVERSSSLQAGDSGGELLWTEVGDHRAWTPLIVLNASSVVDGCRVLMANTAHLPASQSHDCFEARDLGFISGAVDPLASLRQRTCPSEGCQSDITVPAVTSAYISARYPVVAPTAGLVQNVKGRQDPHVTYAVDGGYYENSLFTLIQIWSAVEPLVEQHNEENTMQVEPWIVVLDNHYRSKTTVEPPDRQPEFIAVVTALTTDETLSQTALEQMADAILAKSNSTGSERIPTESRLVILAPSDSPSVSAPLGWVLSRVSTKDLDNQLERALGGEGASYRNPCDLLAALSKTDPNTRCDGPLES